MHAGVDLGGTKIELAVLDGDGAVCLRERRPTPRGDYAGTVEAIRALVFEAEARLRRTLTVGVGAPGTVVTASGCMKNCNSTWLNGRPLPADLSQALVRPVPVANDADCFALSEARDGAGARERTVFGVILGTGVGGGIVHRGELLSGPNGLVGEWGHNPLPALAGPGAELSARAPDALSSGVPPGVPATVLADRAQLASRPCYCGARDCVERWLSGPGLLETWQGLGGTGPAAEHLDGALAAGDPSARRAFELWSWQLAAALATVVNVLDPDVIVVGGGVSRLAALYDVVAARLAARVFGGAGVVQLRPARYGDASGVRGAAWLGATREGQRIGSPQE